ncbi:2-oxoisovalerate dehydrogenase E1 component, beta subunit [Amycolatopsis mediterranei S699]|uniref:2-oxoisovalerate dehydrogenase E1 component, beta subunit n=1 Tax=Amycolatopsis mediterranei (strain U-32) TaxID=749927 RepID=A0A0H3DFF2_AMYMU|nr:2-oxoisovalerate dehydrogenase E1 component, beta subunit [Amycolatopsis mediterranei U32]AFO80650.1 2-oxoisovalerate dehydrogenase E1 component, beta subunit [Amycolatopsis mediterranei S699]AGT87778.1 2-oxoisovalerate dehydrogenase E1 component, beta subunit [Amycolatopsis mediterranei RB]KDU93939.1 2-oxoisovalerate dehydrogenase [Amycolatopsis mediterranei]
MMPSTPADTRTAIRDPSHLISLGRPAIRREGTDVTLGSYSTLVHDCAAVAEQLATEGSASS